MNHRILIVDDEPDIRATVEILLGRFGHESRAAGSVQSALEKLAAEEFDVVLTDMRLGDGTGLDVVRWVSEHRPSTPVAVITAYGSAKDAVNALKEGAFDYVEKPVDTALLRRVVSDALALSGGDDEGREQAGSPSSNDDAGENRSLVGESAAMQRLRDTIEKLGRTQAPVYVYGESGVGKELVAREIHRKSSRAKGPFVAINCGAIPSELFESELFGHVKGSFSGAHTDREGLFSSADGGTLFLDEVVDLPLHMQVKLLRALQERRIRPVGSNSERVVDVRVISAAQQPLDNFVSSGRFREDLFYRLNVIDLHIPPLRERREDIPALAQALITRVAKRHQMRRPIIEDQALEELARRTYPGNVRELENLLERTMALLEKPEAVSAADIPAETGRERSVLSAPPNKQRADATHTPASTSPAENSKAPAYRTNPDSHELRLEGAMKALGLSARGLRYRLTKFGIPYIES